MPETLTITGRITTQGPQAPLAGDTLSLPVYESGVVDRAGSLQPGAPVDVAHRYADVDDPGFAVGRMRRLHLSSDLPAHATLLYPEGRSSGVRRVWFCADSVAIGEAR